MSKGFKCVAISDTHGKHADLNPHLGEGDFIFHTGDITRSKNSKIELHNFINWFGGLKFKHKVFIAGNHDGVLKDIPNVYKGYWAESYGVTYLCDEMVVLDGVRIYGSPWTPTFKEWHFMKNRGEEISKVWAEIPENLDVLLTHGPPYGILDDDKDTTRKGCEELYKRIWQVRPKVHLFGHIHYAYGQRVMDDVEFINSSSLDTNYMYVNPPVEFLL